MQWNDACIHARSFRIRGSIIWNRVRRVFQRAAWLRSFHRGLVVDGSVPLPERLDTRASPAQRHRHTGWFVGWLVVSLVACTNALVPAVLTASLHLSAVKVGATARLVRSRPRALVFVVVASNNAVHSFRPNSSPPLKTARCTSMATRTLFQFLRATSLLGVGATAACRTRPRWWANAPAHRQPLVPCSRH